MGNKVNLFVKYNTSGALGNGFISCLECGTLFCNTDEMCSLCHAKLKKRKNKNLNQTIAYLLTAVILFFPANFMPIMKSSSLGDDRDDTILSGVFVLWEGGSYFIATVVFVASFITPIFKIVSMSYLCYTCYIKSTKKKVFRTKLYHFTETIGKWSMIDVFVVALLGALVKLGRFATVEPQLGVLAFALVVFLTMFATSSFDPRFIWDASNEGLKATDDR